MKSGIVVLFLLLNYQIWAQPECLNINSNISNKGIVNEDFKISDAVIVGEFHGVLGANEIKFELIKILNQEFGFRNIFMEIGTSAAYLYNLYLYTGDTSLLSNPTMPYSIKIQEKHFWHELYKYNLNLTNNLKIKIYGVDFERLEFLKVLKLLAPKEHNPNNSVFTKKLFKENDTLIKSVNKYKDFNKVFASYKKDFYKYIDELRIIYGDNFRYIEYIFLNKSSRKKFKRRNETMYTNIMEIVKKDAITKFIGFFGLNHTNGGRPYTLVGRLINSKKFQSVLNISMVCKNCFDWQQYIKFANYSGPYTYHRDKTLMEALFSNYYLKDCKYTIVPTNIINDEKVKSFSDYLILLKDQPEFN